MTEKIEIDVSNRDVAKEVAHGIIVRARQIHNNPDDEHEDIALELRDVGQELLSDYEENFTR